MKTLLFCHFTLIYLMSTMIWADASDHFERISPAGENISLPTIGVRRPCCAFGHDFTKNSTSPEGVDIAKDLARLRDNLVLPVWTGSNWTNMCDYALSGVTNSVRARRLIVDLNYWEGLNAKWTALMQESDDISFSNEAKQGMLVSRTALGEEGFHVEFDGSYDIWKLAPSAIPFLPALSELKAKRLTGVAARTKGANILLRTPSGIPPVKKRETIREWGLDITVETERQSFWPHRRAALLSVLPAISPTEFDRVLEAENDPRMAFVGEVLFQCFGLGCIPIWSGEQWNDGAVRFESLSGLDDDDRRLLLVLNYRLNPYYGRVWKSVLGDKDPLYGTTKEQIAARFRGKGYNLIREKNSGFLSLTPIEHTAP